MNTIFQYRETFLISENETYYKGLIDSVTAICIETLIQLYRYFLK